MLYFTSNVIFKQNSKNKIQKNQSFVNFNFLLFSVQYLKTIAGGPVQLINQI